MIAIAYQSHVTGNPKLYREALQQIRQWAYAHAGNRRSQAARHFAGGPKARNFIWQADDITIRIRQLANIATIINVKAGVRSDCPGYHAQVFAYAIGELRSDPDAEPTTKDCVLASVISRETGLNPPWDCQEAGYEPLSRILDHVRNSDRAGGGRPRPIIASSEPATDRRLMPIREATDLRQDNMPTLAAPEDTPDEVRQQLEANTAWCDVGYADPAASIIIARSLPDPETAARWLQGELIIRVEETGAITAMPVNDLDNSLTRLRQQYDNTRIYQTVSTIGMLAELLAHNVNPNRKH